jgi:subtilisin family serine protease
MVNQIWSAGGVFVGAAGNDGMFAADYPAAHTNAMCVGATDYWDNACIFSNWGSAVDIAAPGEETSCGHTTDNDYELHGDGTSFSAPLVAAGAALLWSFKPTLTNAEVRDTLESHAGLAWEFFTVVPRLDLSLALLFHIPSLIPSITSVNPTAESLYGSVVAKPSISVSVNGAQNVQNVRYTLDVQPLDQFGPDDPEITVSAGGGFRACCLSLPHCPTSTRNWSCSVSARRGTAATHWRCRCSSATSPAT